jgi:hypothetical protein
MPAGFDLAEKYHLLRELDNRSSRDFFAMETWLNDNIPVAGDVLALKYCMAEQAGEGELRIDGKRRSAEDNLPDSQLGGERSPCSPERACRLTITSARGQSPSLSAGHIGLAWPPRPTASCNEGGGGLAAFRADKKELASAAPGGAGRVFRAAMNLNNKTR